MVLRHADPWVKEGGEWRPVCPDCQRIASPDGRSPQCSDPERDVCDRDIQYVLERVGEKPRE